MLQAYDVLMDGSKRTLYDINLERPQSHTAGTSTRTTQAQWEAAQHNWR
jgi:curved DNA-binding protein CbpA